MKKLILFGLLYIPLNGFSTDKIDYKNINLELTKKYIIQQQKQLDKSIKGFKANSVTLCQNKDPKYLDNVKSSYKELAMQWSKINFISFGPASLNLRRYRFQYFPDKHGTGGKQFTKFVAQKDPKSLDPKTFSDTSVAIQGITAAERLLYDKEYSIKLTGKDKFYCHYLIAISDNLEQINTNILSEWKPILEKISSKKNYDDSDYFLKVYQDLYHLIAFANEVRIKALLGASSKKNRSYKAEYRYANFSKESLLVSLHSFKELFFGFETFKGISSLVQDKKSNTTLLTLTNDVIKSTENIENTLTKATTTTNGRKQLLDTSAKLEKLGIFLKENYSLKVGMYLGFNNLDGD